MTDLELCFCVRFQVARGGEAGWIHRSMFVQNLDLGAEE